MTDRSTATKWVAVVAGIAAVCAVALILGHGPNDSTSGNIEWKKITVTDKVSFCNPPNDPRGYNICVYNAKGTYAHQPWVNRTSSTDAHVFDTQPVTMWIGKVPGETTISVFRVEHPE